MQKDPNAALAKQDSVYKYNEITGEKTSFYIIERVGPDPQSIKKWNINQSEYFKVFSLILNDEQKKKVQSLDKDIRIFDFKHLPSPETLFPFASSINKTWDIDNYGPLWVPKKGVTVNLNSQNLPLYVRIIGVYENNSLEVKGNKIFINGKESTTYTFKQDYYWAMGDNRHNSEDSRMWGFVPHDHIVGKPLFIWFSTKEGSIGNGINWNRIFTGANKK
jgi:signal peptidase I